MKVTLDYHDGIPVLQLKGEFDSFETELVRQGFEACLADGKTHVVFDLGELTFANSTTIAYLITAQKEAAAAGGCVILARTQDFVHKTLSTLGLDRVFELAESVDEAIARAKA